jgi:hypothetical protein
MLQNQQSDIRSAMDSVDDILETLQQTRATANEHFLKVFQWLKDTITPLRIELEKPRTCSRLVHRQNANVASNDIEGYYRITVYLPFLDTMMEQIHLCFTEKTKAAGLFSVLSPYGIC